MTDLTSTYRSKTRRLPEVLNTELFSVDNIIEPKIIEWLDVGAVNNLELLIQEHQIPFEETYFIIDVGGPHLPGIGLYLIKGGADPHFVVPINHVPRMQETLKFFQGEYSTAKEELNEPLGYATLIPGHRSPSMGDVPYTLLPSSFATAEQLQQLGVKRVIYANEGRKGRMNKPFGAFAVRETRQIAETYESNGLEFLQYGLGFELLRHR